MVFWFLISSWWEFDFEELFWRACVEQVESLYGHLKGHQNPWSSVAWKQDERGVSACVESQLSCAELSRWEAQELSALRDKLQVAAALAVRYRTQSHTLVTCKTCVTCLLPPAEVRAPCAFLWSPASSCYRGTTLAFPSPSGPQGWDQGTAPSSRQSPTPQYRCFSPRKPAAWHTLPQPRQKALASQFAKRRLLDPLEDAGILSLTQSWSSDGQNVFHDLVVNYIMSNY